MFRAFDMSMLVWEGEKNMLRLNYIYIYINNYNVFFSARHGFFQQECLGNLQNPMLTLQ